MKTARKSPRVPGVRGPRGKPPPRPEAPSPRFLREERVEVLSAAARDALRAAEADDRAPLGFLQSLADARFASRMCPPVLKDLAERSERGEIEWGRGPQPGDRLAAVLAEMAAEGDAMDALDEAERDALPRETMMEWARNAWTPFVDSTFVGLLGDLHREFALKLYTGVYREDHPDVEGCGCMAVRVTPSGVTIHRGEEARRMARGRPASSDYYEFGSEDDPIEIAGPPDGPPLLN